MPAIPAESYRTIQRKYSGCPPAISSSSCFSSPNSSSRGHVEGEPQKTRIRVTPAREQSTAQSVWPRRAKLPVMTLRENDSHTGGSCGVVHQREWSARAKAAGTSGNADAGKRLSARTARSRGSSFVNRYEATSPNSCALVCRPARSIRGRRRWRETRKYDVLSPYGTITPSDPLSVVTTSESATSKKTLTPRSSRVRLSSAVLASSARRSESTGPREAPRASHVRRAAIITVGSVTLRPASWVGG